VSGVSEPETVTLTVRELIAELLARFDEGDEIAVFSGCCDCGGSNLRFESHDGSAIIIGYPR
jgi:hypothetical protein